MRPASLFIRSAGVEEAPAIVSIWLDTTRDFLSWLPGGFGAPMREPYQGDERADFEVRVRELLGDPNRVARVAVVEDEIRGVLMGEIRKVTEDFFHAPYFYIDHLYVARAFRRAGIGRALLADIEAWARREGMQALDLEVGDRNAAALALYESLGFSVLTRRLAKRLEPDGSAG